MIATQIILQGKKVLLYQHSAEMHSTLTTEYNHLNSLIGNEK